MVFSWRAAAAALVVAGLPGLASAQQAVKVAVVNSRQLLQNAPGVAERQAMLKREGDAFEAQMTKMSDSLKSLDKALKAEAPSLSPPVLATRQKAFDDLLAKFTHQSDSIRSVAERRQGDVLQPVIDQVNKVLQDIRMEDGYSFILDVGADATPIVAYDKNLDITDRVLDRIKKLPAIPLPASLVKPAAAVKPPPPSPTR
jgi:outer membrane protein